MRLRNIALVAAALALAFVLPASATAPSAVLGSPAPDFELTDTDGTKHKLSDYAGKTVVLEWFNPDCPFVVYAHGKKGPLSAQPARVLGEDTVWIAINSGAPGKQGHGLERNQKARVDYGMTYPVLLDEDGAVGQLYGAKTTPHMYVIDGAGTLVYAGGLDDSPMGRGKAPTNHVDACLTDLAGGTAVSTPSTKPYGCSVKY
jgi:peroxiredoxin